MWNIKGNIICGFYFFGFGGNEEFDLEKACVGFLQAIMLKCSIINKKGHNCAC